MAQFDNFTNHIFHAEEWSAPWLSDDEAVRKSVEEFQLVGRTIRKIKTIGISFAHRENELDEYAYQIMKNLPQYQLNGSDGFDDLASDMEMERYLELDEPLIIEFDNYERFEILSTWEGYYCMSMNCIPWCKSSFGHPNVKADMMFDVCLNRIIEDAEFKTQKTEEREYISEIVLWLSGGYGISIRGWETYCEVYCIDRNYRPISIKVRKLRDALFNWENLHEDKVTGFYASTNTLYFNDKGGQVVDNPHISFRPEGSKSVLYVCEDDCAGLEWALSMVLGEQYDIYGDDIRLTHEMWNRFLEEAEMLLTFENYEEMCDYLMMLKNKHCGYPELEYYVNNCGMTFWKNREQHRAQVRDLRVWSALVLQPGADMVVAGS